MRFVVVILITLLCITDASDAQTSRIFTISAVMVYVQSDSTCASNPSACGVDTPTFLCDQAHPCATMDFAIGVLRTYYDAPAMTVQLLPGAFEHGANCMGDGPGSAVIWIVGDPGTPSNVLVRGGISARDKCILDLRGMTLDQAGETCTQLILADQMGVIDVEAGSMILGDCVAGSDIQVNDGGYVNIIDTGPLTINRNATSAFALAAGGSITMRGQAVNLPNQLAFTRFIYNNGGHFNSSGGTFTGSGAGTGTTGDISYTTGCGTTVLGGTSNWPGTSHTGVVGCGQEF